MKKIIPFLAIISLSLSCKKSFLEAPPSVDITEDIIFSSMTQTETFVAATYQVSIPNGYPMSPATERRLNGGILAAACDEGKMANTWSNALNWNTGNVPNNNIIWDEDERVDSRWQAIRKTNILLERINEVPDATEDYKKQVRGDAYFLRALLYFETVKRYGGVPIVARRLDPGDELLMPRNTLEECFTFIVNNCDSAIAALPAAQPTSMRGRATEGAALALKTRALLYAASPLFNTATPYLDLGANNKMICYGNYDQSRWQKAADAAKLTLDWAAASGCTLVNNLGADKNYETVWTQPDNSEIILANKEYGAWGRGEHGIAVILPFWAGSSWQDGGVSVPFNFVRHYEKKDGTPQTWDMNGGNDLLQKYSELDPRFRQTIVTHGDTWNSSVGKISLFGAPYNTYCKGGAWMLKMIPRQLSKTGSDTYVINWIVFRLAEVYLSYAEALNEANAAPPEEAYQAIDVVRQRSGMPTLPRGLSQAQFRDRVRNERAVEMAFEEHRFWDIRRWMIAEQDGVMQGAFYGLRITPSTTDPNEAAYLPTIFENRIWNKREYLHPFTSGEIFKGYLVQNPGW